MRRSLLRKATTTIALLAVALLGFQACVGLPEDDGGIYYGTTGAALTMDIDGDTDVGGMYFHIKRVACTKGESFDPLEKKIRKELEDLRLPGMIPGFEKKPFDPKSGHLFSDYFVVLPAGCYSIKAHPLTRRGKISKDCRHASKAKVKVHDGKTTEVLLISQCDNDPYGALDTAVALNHAPELITGGVQYKPSKFVFECERTVICATVQDPDNDPITFVWKQTKGPKIYGSIKVLSTRRQGKLTTQCVQLSPRWTADYEFTVTAYDMVHDPKSGQMIRIEQYLASRGNPAPSRDTLSFPLYVNWDHEMQCIDKSGKLKHYPGVRKINRVRGCKWTTPADYYCNPKYVDTSKYCPKGQFDPTTVYNACY